MTPSQPTITINIATTVGALPVVSYTYGGQSSQPSCIINGEDLGANHDVAVDFLFQLDGPSIADHWTMTGSMLVKGPASVLTFTPGSGTPCTSYVVHDPGHADGPFAWSFQYTNSITGVVVCDGSAGKHPSIHLLGPQFITDEL